MSRMQRCDQPEIVRQGKKEGKENAGQKDIEDIKDGRSTFKNVDNRKEQGVEQDSRQQAQFGAELVHDKATVYHLFSQRLKEEIDQEKEPNS